MAMRVATRTSITGYSIGEQLGAGGMGVVHAATRHDGTPVAIKLLHASGRHDDYRQRRFRDEIVAGTIVKHPGVVRVLDSGVTRCGLPYLVMERVEGITLAEKIAAADLTVAQSLEIARQLLVALQALHDVGIVHGDVKSDNVLVSECNGTLAVKVIDLGLAKVWLGHSTPTNEVEMISGTPDYLAPEVVQCRGVSPASDLYAATILLYEMLTGNTPFGGGTAQEILTRHLDELAVPPSLRAPELELPFVLDAIVMRGLAKLPHDRPRSAARYASELARVAAKLGSSSGRHARPRLRRDTPTKDWAKSAPVAVQRMQLRRAC